MLDVKKILYPIDLDAIEGSLVKDVLSIALQFDAELHFLFVNDEKASYRQAYNHEDDVALAVKESIPFELLQKVKASFAVSGGDLGEQVANYCSDKKMDLIIAGKSHHSNLYMTFFGTQEEELVNLAPVPVLILPT